MDTRFLISNTRLKSKKKKAKAKQHPRTELLTERKQIWEKKHVCFNENI